MESTEYARRAAYNDTIKTMSHSEHLEVARILRKHGVVLSTNRNGIYFSVDKLPQAVFEELLRFREFVLSNSAELAKRDVAMDVLSRDGGPSD
jgi:cytochrome P450